MGDDDDDDDDFYQPSNDVPIVRHQSQNPLQGIQYITVSNNDDGAYVTTPAVAYTVPCAVWVSGDADDGEALAFALQELLFVHGLALRPDGEPGSGSWWQRFKASVAKGARATFSAAQSEEVTSRLSEAERALKAKYLEHQTAQNDNLKADSASKVLTALAAVDDAVVVLGQLVIAKKGSRVVVKSIDPMTAAKIERTQTLLSDPEAVMKMLSVINSETEPQPALPVLQARTQLEAPPDDEQIVGRA